MKVKILNLLTQINRTIIPTFVGIEIFALLLFAGMQIDDYRFYIVAMAIVINTWYLGPLYIKKYYAKK